MTVKHHLILADPFSLTRNSVRQFYDQRLHGFRIHSAGTGRRALGLAAQHQPCILVLETTLTQPSTLEVLIQLQGDAMVQPLILTHCTVPWVAQVFLERGAKGYLLKSDSHKRFLSAVKKLAQGEGGWISQTILSGLYSQTGGKGPSVDVARRALTQREWEVMIMTARGKDNSQLADYLCISVGTVKNHLYHVFDKLSMSSRLELITWAYDRSLFRLGTDLALAAHPSS